MIKNKLNSCLIAFLMLLFGPGQIFSVDKETPLKVLCYNIHHANPPSKPDFIDLPAIARVIRESGADLVALQEVDVHTLRSGKDVHQARELAKLTGMYSFFVKTIDHGGGDYGIAILSKFPILDSASYKLPMKEGAGGEPRGVAEITVKLPGGKKILFASTHLDLKAANKVLHSAELNRIFKNRRFPVILAGDFNSTPDSEVIKELDGQFTRTCTEHCGFTIPEVNPTRTIDYIMFNKTAKIEVLSHKVIAEPYASDHLPVLAELRLK